MSSRLSFIGNIAAVNVTINEDRWVRFSESIHSPAPFKNPLISKVYPMNGFVIYTDQDINNIWISTSSSQKTKNPINIQSEITYFKDNNIKIKKICSNIISECVFFITNTNKLYAYGNNHQDRLQIGVPFNKENGPQLLPFQNVIHIQSCRSYVIAVCSETVPIYQKMSLRERDRLFEPRRSRGS